MYPRDSTFAKVRRHHCMVFGSLGKNSVAIAKLTWASMIVPSGALGYAHIASNICADLYASSVSSGANGFLNAMDIEMLNMKFMLQKSSNRKFVVHRSSAQMTLGSKAFTISSGPDRPGMFSTL